MLSREVEEGIETAAEGMTQVFVYVVPFFILVPALLYQLGGGSIFYALSPIAVGLALFFLYRSGTFSSKTIFDVSVLGWIVFSSGIIFYAVTTTFGFEVIVLAVIFLVFSFVGVVAMRKAQWKQPVNKGKETKKDRRVARIKQIKLAQRL
eukprot:TRINITY_DN17519_c0_g2_i1.p1 TRINITY_DN17519_c0_g2~~TRINITY_DN17519_c0_g2_i1.p1  ORF type:complete len:150 (-),score=15.40 TRINITY_DN17519_c0_g2_i1:180-629(-)